MERVVFIMAAKKESKLLQLGKKSKIPNSPQKAILEIKLSELSLCAVEQISARGLKRKQRIYEIVGNERARVGGERKMHRIPTGSTLTSMIIKEFIFWRR